MNTQAVILLTPNSPQLTGKYPADAISIVVELDSSVAGFTVYLPDAKSNMNREFIFKNIGANQVTVSTVLGQLIDNYETSHIIEYRDCVRLFSNRESRWVMTDYNATVFPTPIIFRDLTNPSNYTQIEQDGTIVSDGAATTYDDIQFPVGSGKVPAVNFPTWETFTTNTQQYSFAVNDHIQLNCNEPFHGWKEGTSASFHAHVTTKAANASGSNWYAKFTVYIGYCDYVGVWQEISVTAELTIPTGTAAMQQFLLVLGNLTLTGYHIGSQICPHLKRIAATSGTEYSGNIFVTQVGAHIQQDMTGSRNVSSK